MTNKFSIFIILILIVVSCGKKADPEYKSSQIKTETQNFIIKKI
tara:strand:- start:176 stop:307 length:132 start_codon:yes stop_codon:yes gene_type:complete